jgi:dihydroorotate dehydrogenase (NAD+) catalytic subunit
LPETFIIVKFGLDGYETGALEAYKAGADAMSLINTVPAMKIDIYSRKLVFQSGRAGMSGSNIHSIAIAAILSLSELKIPKIGMGGITCGKDAIEMMLAGASAVAVGTELLINFGIFTEIHNDIVKYMKLMSVKNVAELTGNIVRD